MAQLKGQARADYVRGMFDRIAGRYDLMNRLITGGQDRKWRRFVVDMAGLPAGGALLDIATGTGDIALEALRRQPDARVVGADFALGMMRVGQARRGGGEVRWSGADALQLPFADASFDAVASGYLLRNVIDISRALAEQHRVLKPGGRIVIPGYLAAAGQLAQAADYAASAPGDSAFGARDRGEAAADAYRYLPESTAAFKTPEELTALVTAAGFTRVRYRQFMFGTMSVHWADKP